MMKLICAIILVCCFGVEKATQVLKQRADVLAFGTSLSHCSMSSLCLTVSILSSTVDKSNA